MVGGGSSIWVFIYCVWYYFTKLNIVGFVSGLLFFAYSGMACVVYGLLTGTVGFLTALIFVRRIYGLVPSPFLPLPLNILTIKTAQSKQTKYQISKADSKEHIEKDLNGKVNRLKAFTDTKKKTNMS